ncbi:MAG: dephospho-CoA kinase [Betaproteobacteria bacterium]
MSTYVVGLTGGIGSGKTTVTDLFASHGVAIVDTDLIAHQLTGPAGAAMPAIVAEFGTTVAQPDGALDRPAMRSLVFADPRARERLEGILHPMIIAVALAEIAAAGTSYVVVAVPLLIEGGRWRERCDRVLVVDCDEKTQIARVMARSKLTEAEVRNILAAQVDRLTRLAAADDVIDNNGDRENLVGHVAALHQRYLGFAAAKKLQANC